MKNSVLVYFLLSLLLISRTIWGQAVFTSTASGSWNNAATWTLVSGTTADNIPHAFDNVTIASTHIITIDQNAEVANLTFEASSSKLDFSVANMTLTVYGNLVGAASTDDYVNATSLGNATGTKIIFAGTGTQTITLIGISTNWPDFEVNKSSGSLTLSQQLRVDGSLIGSAGIIDANSLQISMASTSTIAIAAACSLKNVDRIAQTGGGSGKVASITIDGYLGTGTGYGSIYTTALTVNSGGMLEIKGTSSGFVNTAGSENPTTMTCNTGSTVKYSGMAAAGRFVNYSNLSLSGGTTAGSAIKTFTGPSGTMTIGGDLTISNGARLLGGPNYIVNGTTTINDNGEIVWNGVSGQTFTFNGVLNINGNSGNGTIRFGGASTTTPTYICNGDVTVSAATTVSAFNLNSPTLSSANNTFEANLQFNGNVNLASASTFLSANASYPPSTNVSFGGSGKTLAIISGTSGTINLRGDISFSTSRTITAPAGTNFTFTTRPASVTPEWTVKIDNGVTLTISTGTTVLLPNRVFANGTGAGKLQLDGELKIALAGGWNSAVTITGTKTLGSNSIITYNGSVAQTTGAALPASIANLTVNNTAGVTLSSSLSLNGTLTLSNGMLTLGANNLTLSAASTISGTPTAAVHINASGTGQLIRAFTSDLSSAFTYPVGDASNYTPVTLNALTAASYSSASIGVNLANTKYASNLSTTDYLKRYWKLTATGITDPTYQITLIYVVGDVSGTEGNLYGGKYDGSAWVGLGPVNTTTHSIGLSGIKSFSVFTAGEQASLPVELTSFSSSVSGRTVSLTWQTATEINANRFIIERSIKNAAKWISVGAQNASGYSNAVHNYHFTDKGLMTGKYVYRLKIVDNDGTFQTSEEAEAMISIPQSFSVLQNYPNPFNPSTKIEYSLPVDARVSIEIYTIAGTKVATVVNQDQAAGYNSCIVQSNNQMVSGVYFYRLTARDNKSNVLFSQVKKMVLLK